MPESVRIDIDLRLCADCPHFEDGDVWLYCTVEEEIVQLAEESWEVFEKKWFITADTSMVPNCPYLVEQVVTSDDD